MDLEMQATLEQVKAALEESTQASRATAGAIGELRSAVGQQSDRIGGLEARIGEQANSSLEAHEKTRSQVAMLAAELSDLKAFVHGTEPPPPPKPGDPPTPPLAEQASALAELAQGADQKVSGVKLEHAALEGRVIRLEARVMKELEAQSKAMGIAGSGVATFKDAVRWAISPSGRRGLARLATVAGTAYAAFKLATVSPAPAPPPPQPTAALVALDAGTR